MLTFFLKESFLFLNPTGTSIVLPVFIESQVGSLGLDRQSRKFASVDETESGETSGGRAQTPQGQAYRVGGKDRPPLWGKDRGGTSLSVS